MRILVTGASGNVGRGMVERLRTTGHELVVSDLNQLPDDPTYAGLEFVQCDVQAGFGLDRAAAGCDLLLHTPAWHGIHSATKTEVDFWRLNVDGTFYALQAAKSAGITRLVFLSSMSWHGHYGKYGFTKQIGEELCEYHRRNSDMRYVAVRPHDFTPWGADYLNRYGARLLYGGVDREDVLDCIERAVGHLTVDLPAGTEPDGVIVNAVRANAFTADQLEGWEQDPVGVCERIFPGARELVEKYRLDIAGKPAVVDQLGAAAIGYTPDHHFGTFLTELRTLDAQGGADAVGQVACPY
jgi:NAD(P)-dependent dehydrogenase (short-subunit alcohol dehydrogenase family)